MKYSEFKRLVVQEGYEVADKVENIEVTDGKGNVIFYVNKTETLKLDTDFIMFGVNKERLFYLAVELASTPLDEREDEKRYRLKLPFIKWYGYLNLDTIDGVYELSSERQVNNYQTIFTESEIAELKEKHNLDSFVMEEVKENE